MIYQLLMILVMIVLCITNSLTGVVNTIQIHSIHMRNAASALENEWLKNTSITKVKMMNGTTVKYDKNHNHNIMYKNNVH